MLLCLGLLLLGTLDQLRSRKQVDETSSITGGAVFEVIVVCSDCGGLEYGRYGGVVVVWYGMVVW